MDESSIITQVKRDDDVASDLEATECQQLNSNGNHIVPEKELKPPLKKRRERGLFSSIFCCFGGSGTSASARPFEGEQQPCNPTGNTTAGVITQVSAHTDSNHNQSNTSPLTQAGHNQTLAQYPQNAEDEEEELHTSNASSPELFYLLPPLEERDVNKKCMVIDLDETLVHSSFKPVQNADFIVPVEIDGTVHQVYVLKRPYVDEFLKRMGELFECILFTASLAKYADPVADLLDITGCFRTRLFRESCVFYKGNYVKDLSKLGRDLDNTCIVDNSPASYIFHPQNAIPCMSWFDDQDDTELRDILPFMESLAKIDNCVVGLENNRNRCRPGEKFTMLSNGDG